VRRTPETALTAVPPRTKEERGFYWGNLHLFTQERFVSHLEADSFLSMLTLRSYNTCSKKCHTGSLLYGEYRKIMRRLYCRSPEECQSDSVFLAIAWWDFLYDIIRNKQIKL
jgi:hypothetical protein